MKRISMQEFDELMKRINNSRPFKMYIHNTTNEAGNNFVNGENLNINEGRNCASSTVVNGGLITDNYPYKFENYDHIHGNANAIIIMPNELTISGYAGAPLGNNATSKGYYNHIYLDFLIAGVNKFFDDNYTESTLLNLNNINNSLILGYYDKSTNEFVLNENCLLLDENINTYNSVISNANTYANDFYDTAIKTAVAKFFGFGVASDLNDPNFFENLKLNAQINYFQSKEADYDIDISDTNLLVPPTFNTEFVSNFINAYTTTLDEVSTINNLPENQPSTSDEFEKYEDEFNTDNDFQVETINSQDISNYDLDSLEDDFMDL